MPRGSGARSVSVAARAKLNLGLAVGPRRPDGFHDLATILQSVSLHDTVRVAPRPRGFTLAIRHEDGSLGPGKSGGSPRAARKASEPKVPRGAPNLVLRAARAVVSHTGLARGARFELTKRIPAGAGLGGGSADAAAAIVALDRLYRLALGREGRQAIGASVGSDVPFALVGGTAVGLGRGERLRPLRLRRPFRAVIAVPRWRVSTARAFRALDRRKLALTLWNANLRFAQRLGREWLTPIQAMRLGNSFERVLGNRRRDFVSLCERLRRAGIAEPRLTGSGSAVFGILAPETSATSVVGRFSGSERLFLVRSTRDGVRFAASR